MLPYHLATRHMIFSRQLNVYFFNAKIAKESAKGAKEKLVLNVGVAEQDLNLRITELR
ncbi:MAG: hypothetical protein WBB28_00075 [Crinalium sp.]